MKQYDVLAVGELNLDLLITGLDRMPVPGQEIIAKGAALVLGSSTAICAAGTARLGLKTAMCSLAGADDFGIKAKGFLEEYDVDTRLIRFEPSLQTGLTVSLSDPNDRAMITHLGAISEMCAESVDRKEMEKARHLHVGSFFLQKKIRPGLAKLFADAKGMGMTTSLDAGWDDTQNWDYGLWDVLKQTDIFFPNALEAMSITKESTPESAAKKLAKVCRIAAVKCGSHGAILSEKGQLLSARAYAREHVLDTTGAGDSFNAGFIYGFLSGRDLQRCLEYGNACAAISVTRIGGASACATVNEAEKVMREGSL